MCKHPHQTAVCQCRKNKTIPNNNAAKDNEWQALRVRSCGGGRRLKRVLLTQPRKACEIDVTMHTGKERSLQHHKIHRAATLHISEGGKEINTAT